MRTCFYCGQPADTKDHVVPKAKGGRANDKNLVDACRLCNGTKGTISQEDFIKFLEWLKEKGFTLKVLTRHWRKIYKQNFLRETGINVAHVGELNNLTLPKDERLKALKNI